MSHQTSIRLNWNNSVLSGGGCPGKHEDLVTWGMLRNLIISPFVCLLREYVAVLGFIDTLVILSEAGSKMLHVSVNSS